MQPHARYEIIDKIAQGAFATVYRARDLQLQREVAIKQIHAQYLEDPKQSERYWQEAQILARLEHPHVMTIYDVVRDRGWLILELMQGSLKQRLAGRAINLNDLRLTILSVARALTFFEKNGIIHGDVKPTNILIDRNSRIKLGDFGFARRIQGDEGSVVKGTTRYMAPEVVSDQFGPVGPHSDVYSLGFSAFELMCGDHFESLFPGLNMFGRDQQVAWMMWHADPNRRLPEIRKVLEGVPEDLAAVIERMSQKDPARRYQNAEQVIADLGQEGRIYARPEAGESAEAAAQQARQTRRKRSLTIAAVTGSMLLSVGMLFWKPAPSGLDGRKPAIREGIVGKVDVPGRRIYLQTEDQIRIGQRDQIIVNSELAGLADLRPNDRLSIDHLQGQDGQTFQQIRAVRSELGQFSGSFVAWDQNAQKLSLSDTEGQSRPFLVTGETTVTLNGQPAVLADLQSGDQATVDFRSGEMGSHASAVAAKRSLEAEGSVVSFNTTTGELTFQSGDIPRTLPLADTCTITINGRAELSGRTITLADLEQGDAIVRLAYDTHVLGMDVTRQIKDLVQVEAVDRNAAMLSVTIGSQLADIAASRAAISYRQQPVDLAFIRKGDKLTVEHDAPDRRGIVARAIEVTELARDPRVVAVIIGQQRYADIRVTPPKFAAADVQRLQRALDEGSRVPDTQLLVLVDQQRDNLLRLLQDFLRSNGKSQQLLVYVVGQAFVDPATKSTWLAAEDFKLADPAGTGLSLSKLIGLLEQQQSREKILLLDTCHEVSAAELPLQPSTAEQVENTITGTAVSRSVTVIGSCSAGQRVKAASADSQHGIFAQALASALLGKADVNGDQLVTADELADYLRRDLPRQGLTPAVFLPDTRPPRLNDQARQAIAEMLQTVDLGRAVAGFDEAYATAGQAAPDQPDPLVAFAVARLRINKTGEATKGFEEALTQFPDALVAYHGLAFQLFAQGKPKSAADVVVALLNQLARHDLAEGPYISYLLQFAGKARQYLELEWESLELAQAVDRAAGQLAPDQQRAFTQGKEAFDKQHYEHYRAKALEKLAFNRYAPFDYELVSEYLKGRLDR